MILLDVLEDHLDEVGFLHSQRQVYLDSLSLTLSHLAELDERLAAHVDGLCVGGNAGWELVAPLARSKEAEACFTAWMVALESGREEWVRELEESRPSEDSDSVAGIRWALRLSRSRAAEDLLRRLSAGSDELSLALAIDGICFRRVDPGALLSGGGGRPSPLLRRVILHAAGVFRRRELLPEVRIGLTDEDSVAVEALEALALIDAPEGRSRCADRLALEGSVGSRAAGLLGALGNLEDRPLLERFALCRERRTARAAILALGELGCPDSIPFLLDLLEADVFAGVVGVALQRVLGSAVSWREARADRPTRPASAQPVAPRSGSEAAADQASASDSEEEENRDPDDDLPRFVAAKVRAAWEARRGQLTPSERYRGGEPFHPGPPRPLTPLALRHGEAVEEALASPGKPPRETWDLALRQGRADLGTA